MQVTIRPDADTGGSARRARSISRLSSTLALSGEPDCHGPYGDHTGP